MLHLLFYRARFDPALGLWGYEGECKDFRAFSGENLRGR